MRLKPARESLAGVSKAKRKQKKSSKPKRPRTLVEQLSREVERCHRNDGTWELFDNSPLKLAVGLVLWPESDKVRSLAKAVGFDDDDVHAALDPELASAVQAIRIGDLEKEIEEAADRFEQKPPTPADLTTNKWTDIAALRLLGYTPRWSVPPEAADYHSATEKARNWREQFASYGDRLISTDLQRRIRSAFRGEGEFRAELARFARTPGDAELRALAERCNVLERSLANAEALPTLTRLRQHLRAAEKALLVEADKRCDKAKVISGFLNVKSGRGNSKNHEAHHVILALANVYEKMTGNMATANPTTIGDRQTGFVRFAQEMCHRAAREDLFRSIEGTAPGLFKGRGKARADPKADN